MNRTGLEQDDVPPASTRKPQPPVGIGPRVALRVYRGLGPDRSIQKLQKALQEQSPGMPVPSARHLRQWAREGDWERLCTIWDRENPTYLTDPISPLVPIWRQLAKQIRVASTRPLPLTFRECKRLVRQVDELFALVRQFELEQERHERASSEALAREAPTLEGLLALLRKELKKNRAPGTPQSPPSDILEALASESLGTARRVSQALLWWARRQPTLGRARGDTSTASELVLLRASLDERIQAFEAQNNERQARKERYQNKSGATIEEEIAELEADIAQQEVMERRVRERQERLRSPRPAASSAAGPPTPRDRRTL